MLIPAAVVLVYALMSLSQTMVLVVIVMPIPLLIAILTVRRSVQTRKAAQWARASARITRSEIEAQHFKKDVTQVTNVPRIEYDFEAGAQTIHGNRVSFGDAGPTPQDVLKRYPAGAVVSVYYDPANPADCVLEREAPVHLGCIWAVAATALLTGVAAIVAMLHLTEIDTSLAKSVPLLGPSPVFTLVLRAAVSSC